MGFLVVRRLLQHCKARTASAQGVERIKWVMFPNIVGKAVLFWIKFNHSKEKEIKSRFYWDGQYLCLNPIMRSYKVG